MKTTPLHFVTTIIYRKTIICNFYRNLVIILSEPNRFFRRLFMTL